MNMSLGFRPCTASALLVGVVLMVSSVFALAELEFNTQPITYPAKYFEPVDIEGDGIWELALQVGANGDSVGVYSPLKHKWIDGPHYLPVEGNNWGAFTFKKNAPFLIQYVYLIDGLACALKSHLDVGALPFGSGQFNDSLQVWGKAADGNPRLFFSGKGFYVWNYDCYLGCDNSATAYSGWKGYTIHDGNLFNWSEAAAQKGRACFGSNSTPLPFLVTYSQEERSESLPIPEGRLNFVQRKIVLWERQSEEPIEYYLGQFTPEEYSTDDSFYHHEPGAHYQHVACGDLAANSMPTVYYIAGGSTLFPNQIFYYFGATGQWEMPFDSTRAAGLAYYDLDRDSHPELIMPLTAQNVWARYDPASGSYIDSLPGLPPADLRTAPILEADKLDLYYFLDSTLYILDRPGMSTGILAEDEETGIPETFTLHQNYPNPFNVSTVIGFELTNPGLVKLEIYNILGKKVAVLLDEYRPAGIHRVSWEGTGADGMELVSGIYFSRLAVGDSRQIRKMTLLK